MKDFNDLERDYNNSIIEANLEGEQCLNDIESSIVKFKVNDNVSVSPTLTGLGKWVHGVVEEVNGTDLTMRADVIQEDGKRFFYHHKKWFVLRIEGEKNNQTAIAERLIKKIKDI